MEVIQAPFEELGFDRVRNIFSRMFYSFDRTRNYSQKAESMDTDVSTDVG